MMRLVRVGPAVQLCLRAEGAPVTPIPKFILVLVTENDSRVLFRPAAVPGAVTMLWSEVQLCPWAKLVRATAALISRHPWLSPLRWP